LFWIISALCVAVVVCAPMALASPVSVAPGATYHTPAGNDVTNGGTAPIVVDTYTTSEGEAIEVVGDKAFVDAMVHGTDVWVDGDDSAVNLAAANLSVQQDGEGAKQGTPGPHPSITEDKGANAAGQPVHKSTTT